jgi:hypothetical protein
VIDQELLAKASGALAPAADPAAALLDLAVRVTCGIGLAAQQAAQAPGATATSVTQAVLQQAARARKDLAAWAHGPLGIGMSQDEVIGLTWIVGRGLNRLG